MYKIILSTYLFIIGCLMHFFRERSFSEIIFLQIISLFTKIPVFKRMNLSRQGAKNAKFFQPLIEIYKYQKSSFTYFYKEFGEISFIGYYKFHL